MEFRSLKRQYHKIKKQIDKEICEVIADSCYISGTKVKEIEERLAEYVGVKHCISCANGTDALQLALMAWGIGPGDAVFVPDFTFFSSGEVVATVGAVPIFVDVKADTYNIDPEKLKKTIKKVKEEGRLRSKAIITVDLFGQPADYQIIMGIAKEYDLYILEDGAQGFGGRIKKDKACSFGDISTTSFFPMKPLGCYGDGGAVFTDNTEWAELIRSYCVHGKGNTKYDNVRIGLNSRLDSIQAAVLLAKLPQFVSYELDAVNENADYYSRRLNGIVKIPSIMDGHYSSWAQYTIQLKDMEMRDGIKKALNDKHIPSFIYYPKPMHRQKAFTDLIEYDQNRYEDNSFNVTEKLCETVLSLPMSPYLERIEIDEVIREIETYVETKALSFN